MRISCSQAWIVVCVSGALLGVAGCVGHARGADPGAVPGLVAQAEPLPPFEKFFTPVSYVAPQLSPDGRWLAWIAPVAGVNNFFVAPRADLADKRQLTFRVGQGVRPTDVSGVVMYRWSADSRYLIYPHDYAGDEHWNLWRVDVAGGGEKNLTPDPARSFSIMQVSRQHPDRIAVSGGTFGKYDSVTYTLDLASGRLEQIVPNELGTLGLLVDAEFEPRVRVVISPERDLMIEYRHGAGWSLLRRIPKEDRNELAQAGYQQISRISADGRRLYTYGSAGRNTNALVAYDLESGAVETLAGDERVDLGGVLYDPRLDRPLAYQANWVRQEWHAIDPSVTGDLARLAARYPDADYKVVSLSEDNRQWVVEFMFANAPIQYYLYDRDTGGMRELAVATPELKSVALARTHATVMQSSDELPLISYYSLPVGSDPDGDGVPAAPLPVVMLVHGGPGDERAMYGFSGFVQWLTSRGYVVYNMNYRGSAGFGKAYANAANGEWSGRMHTDLIEQLDEIIRRGIADPKRVAIMGGSYGGYATLVGMTMTPGVFACGVDLVGPSSLEIPMPHWDPAEMAIFLGGDPRTEEGRAFLRSRSPLAHAHRTTGGVLIGQGANDSRVPQQQSDQMVRIMEQAGARVVYAVFPDEGHGFRRVENVRAFWGITEVFLGGCLGGRYEPIGDKLAGSSITVPTGAGRVSGLPEALAELASRKR